MAAVWDRQVKCEQPSRNLCRSLGKRRCNNLGPSPKKLRPNPDEVMPSTQDSPPNDKHAEPSPICLQYVQGPGQVDDAEPSAPLCVIYEDLTHAMVEQHDDNMDETMVDGTYEYTDDDPVPVATGTMPNPCILVTSERYPEQGIFCFSGYPTETERAQLAAKLEGERTLLQGSDEWRKLHGSDRSLLSPDDYALWAKFWHEEAVEQVERIVENPRPGIHLRNRRVKKVMPVIDNCDFGSTCQVTPITSPLRNGLSMEEWEEKENTDEAEWIWMSDEAKSVYADPDMVWGKTDDEKDGTSDCEDWDTVFDATVWDTSMESLESSGSPDSSRSPDSPTSPESMDEVDGMDDMDKSTGTREILGSAIVV